MTPKEKAEDIVDKFISDGLLDKYMDVQSAKQCALIAVDYIWEELENAKLNEQYHFWEEVKAEIELL
jgi:hypothetical protein